MGVERGIVRERFQLRPSKRDRHHGGGRWVRPDWRRPHTGAAAMNAVATPKSPVLNLLEGMTLTAIFQAFPTFTAAVLLVKLSGASELTSRSGSIVTFIVLAMLFQTLAVTWLGPLFPRFFRNAYEPLFYDATLSFGEKIARWRVQPVASLQLLTTVMMLSLLAVAVVSVR
jgi:hypothetical protein